MGENIKEIVLKEEFFYSTLGIFQILTTREHFYKIINKIGSTTESLHILQNNGFIKFIG